MRTMTVAEMTARYTQGATLHQIAEEAGLCHTTIHYHLKRSGMKLRPRIQPADPDFIAAVKLMRRDKMSFGNIAKMTGTTRGTIAGLVWRHIKRVTA